MKVALEISVIVPIYNQEIYLGRCLRSIIDQSFSDFEVILINDGSTDGSLQICEEFAKKDDRLTIIDKPNEGVTLARKDGTIKSRGKYLFYIDSDDMLPQNALSTLYSLAKPKDLDLVIGNHQRIFDNWKIAKKKVSPFLAPSDRILSGNSFLQMILGLDNSSEEKSWGTYLWGRLYKREKVMKALANDEALLFPSYTKGALIEDMAFNLAVAPYIESLWITNENTYYYRYGGATSKDFPIVRKGGDYFDSRYESCIKYKHEELLNDVFCHYSSCLTLDVLFQIHFHTRNQEIVRFVQDEFGRRKIVLWIREHISNAEKTDFQNAIMTNNPTLFVELCRKREQDMRTHFLLKKIVFLYQRVMDRVGVTML